MSEKKQKSIILIDDSICQECGERGASSSEHVCHVPNPPRYVELLPDPYKIMLALSQVRPAKADET
jgi:hypothetical protein